MARTRKVFNFHGAFKSKRAAVGKEREVNHSFIERFGYRGGKRYAVVTRKGK
jgi:hypothetical protein